MRSVSIFETGIVKNDHDRCCLVAAAPSLKLSHHDTVESHCRLTFMFNILVNRNILPEKLGGLVGRGGVIRAVGELLAFSKPPNTSRE